MPGLSVTKKKMAGPSIKIDPDHCQDCCQDKKDHAPGKSNNGYVDFNATKACTLCFTNSSVFGSSSVPLNKGHNQITTQTDNGQTGYYIDGCPCKSEGNPNQIVVP